MIILVRSDLDFNPSTISCDDEGRSIIIEAEGIRFYLWTDNKRCYNPIESHLYEKEKKAKEMSFLNLETHKKAKSSVRKVFDNNGVLITDPKKILQ